MYEGIPSTNERRPSVAQERVSPLEESIRYSLPGLKKQLIDEFEGAA